MASAALSATPAMIAGFKCYKVIGVCSQKWNVRKTYNSRAECMFHRLRDTSVTSQVLATFLLSGQLLLQTQLVDALKRLPSHFACASAVE
jgi:hypothetical protein